jgi:septal ring factor EnvC (AmiA/AmiB activator)
MLIEYEDLIKHLTQFRLEVIEALAALDAEVNAIHHAIVAKKPLLTEDLNRLRAKSRKLQGKFEESYERKLPLLHEKR